MVKESALVYDIVSVPEGMTLEMIVTTWKQHDFILWDSRNGGSEPSKTGIIKGMVVDISNTTPETLSKINKLIKS